MNRYHSCFISAPFGLDLGALPSLLAQRGISWEWANKEEGVAQDSASGIAAVDFMLAVLNGTRADYRGAYDIGLAVGLGKPVLLIQTQARSLPIDYRRFTTIRVGLKNFEALSFHLDLFLAAPPFKPNIEKVERADRDLSLLRSQTLDARPRLLSDLAQRAYDAVLLAGGSAVAEPVSSTHSKFRPDLLAWLGNVDPELLDPVAIELRQGAYSKTARRVEEQLLGFMQGARIRTGLVLTSDQPAELRLSPNIIWLKIDDFEALIRADKLGKYVRETRNRAMHGAR